MDLDAYLARIGYSGSRAPTLDTLHALTKAHATSIPFENLDVLLGHPIELEMDSVFDKLVTRRRGGYCFEQNTLFLSVLESLGFAAEPLSARVRLNRPRDFLPPRTHVFLRVTVAGEPWLTDVGVGAASLTSAIRFVADEPQVTPHDTRRLVREGAVWMHQVRWGDTWQDVYDYTGEGMPPIDREVANWFTSAHPRSHFRGRVMVARALPDGGRISVQDRELTIRDPGGRTSHQRQLASNDELLEVLRDRFALELPVGTRLLLT